MFIYIYILSKHCTNCFCHSFSNLLSWISKAVNYSPMENLFNTRSAASSLFQVQRPKLKLCEQNFWFRSTRLANLAPSYVDITDIGSLKKGLL